MKILVTGATGFLGTRVCQKLNEAEHTVTALSRDPSLAHRFVPSLKSVFRWDSLNEAAPTEALDGVDAVVHLAGESVAGRWNDSKKRAIRESRILGTRHLIEGLTKLQAKPNVLISASAIGFYGDRGEEHLTEESAPGSDFLSGVCRDWEAEAVKAESLGLRVVRLRIGIVLGPGGGALRAMLTPFKAGLGGPMGSGHQWWSWIHRDDVVGLMLHALQSDLSGPVNATAPNPMRQGVFARTLGKVLKRPAIAPVPAFALKMLLGEFSTELLSSKFVLPKRAQETKYQFQFPELELALSEILK
ncbi:TIGR01777 family protein [Candidatus Acetothermia bacterium]|nr:TIGR01777 family protein [Candidatus Acetothermia bacterium]